MSLDVYLKGTVRSEPERWAIFIREDGENREVSRAEWDKRFPNNEPVMAKVGGETAELYSANITHNLNTMAVAAGIYEPLWRPDEIGIGHAKQLIQLLADGLERLRADPDKFKVHNPSNGWGTYEGLVRFVEEYRDACELYPDATVNVWR